MEVEGVRDGGAMVERRSPDTRPSQAPEVRGGVHETAIRVGIGLGRGALTAEVRGRAVDGSESDITSMLNHLSSRGSPALDVNRRVPPSFFRMFNPIVALLVDAGASVPVRPFGAGFEFGPKLVRSSKDVTELFIIIVQFFAPVGASSEP